MAELPKITQRIEIKTDLIVVKKFNREIDESAKALGTLDKAAGETEATLGRGTKTLDRSARSHRSYTSAVVDAERGTRTLGRSLSAVGDEATDLGRDLDRGVRGFVTIGGRMRSTSNETKTLNKSLKDLRTSLKTAGNVGQAFVAVLALKLPIVVAGLNLATQAVGALGAGFIGLIRSIGPVFNLFGLLPGLLTAAVGGFGALLIAVKPVAAAIGLALDPKTFAGNGETARQRTRRLADAIRDVARAQEDLDDANRDEERSRKELNDAYREAVENLRDLREEQERGTISVQRAEIALTRAKEQQNLVDADSASTSVDRLDALLDVQDAELDLKDAQERRVDLARQLHEAEEQGVKGSDKVRDAAEQQSDAIQRIADAQLALTRAIEDQADPQIKATSGAQNYADALSKLSPEARKFVETIKAQQGTFKDIRNDVQDALFKPINEGFKGITGNANPIKAFFVESAAAVGEVGKSILGFFSSKGFGKDLETLGKNNGEIIRSLAAPAKDLLKIFTDLAVVGGPFIKQLIDLAAGAIGRFADKVGALRSSGGLAKFFQDGIDRAKVFGGIFSDIFGGIRNILRASTSLGDSLLGSLEKGAEKFKIFTGSTSGQNQLKQFFDDAKVPLHEFALLLKDVFGLFINIGKQNGLAKVLAEIRTRGIPILKKVFDSVGPDFIGRLLDLAAAFGELFANLGGTTGPFSALINAFIILFKTVNGALTLVPQLKTLLTLLLSIGGAIKLLSLTTKVTGLGAVKDTFDVIASKASQTLSHLRNMSTVKVPALNALNVPIVGPSSPISGKPKTPSAGIGSAIGGLAASIGPQIGIMAALTGATFLVTKQFEKWAKRTRELKQITEDFTGALEDQNTTVSEAATAAAKPLLVSRHQVDDLEDAGIAVSDLGDAIAKGHDGLVDFRQQLIDADAIKFENIGGLGVSLDQARQAFVETGKILPGFTTDNNGLVRSMQDLVTQTDKAAEAQLRHLQAEGKVTQATLDNEQAQLALEGGLRTVLAPSLVDHIELLDRVREAERKKNDEQQRAIDQAQKIQDSALDGLGTELGLNRAKDRAVKSGKALQKAELDLAAAQFKRDPDAITEAQTAYNDALQASQDDTLAVADAAKAYFQSQVDLGKITDDNTFKYQAQKKALDDVFTQLGQGSGASAAFIQETQAALDKANFSATLTLNPGGLIANPFNGQDSPEGNATKVLRAIEENPAIKLLKTLTGNSGTKVNDITIAAANNITINAKAAVPGATGGAATTAAAGGKAVPIAPPRSANAANATTRHYTAAGKGNPDAPPPPFPVPNQGRNALAKYDSAKKQWYYEYRKGGKLGGIPGLAGGGWSGVGAGFMTKGPKAIVGEGRKAFPEFVIPTDPLHRKNALVLVGELLKRIGGGAGSLKERRDAARRAIRDDASLGGRRFNQSFVDDLVNQRVHLLAGGGTLGFDPDAILRAVLGSRVEALRSQHADQADAALALREREGAGIGLAARHAALAHNALGVSRSVGVEQNFAGATFLIRDFDDFREQMERERRKANLAAVSSGRSPRR